MPVRAKHRCVVGAAAIVWGLALTPGARDAAAHAPTAAPPAHADVGHARLVAAGDAVLSTDVAARRAASLMLAQDMSAHGIALLYVLAHDFDPGVQQDALAAALDRCAQETPTICAGMMRFFVGEFADDETSANVNLPDNDTHWAARDWLLLGDPKSATHGATLSYKLDVVTRMAQRADDPVLGQGALRVLRMLAEDPQPEVQEAAAAVLLRARM